MTYVGTIIKESLTTYKCLSRLSNKKEEIWEAENTADFQPKIWNAIHFENHDDKYKELAELLSSEIKEKWYCNFQTDDEVYVVFKDKAFCYKKSDESAKNEVKEYGRQLGIPEAQLDW